MTLVETLHQLTDALALVPYAVAAVAILGFIIWCAGKLS